MYTLKIEGPKRESQGTPNSTVKHKEELQKNDHNIVSAYLKARNAKPKIH